MLRPPSSSLCLPALVIAAAVVQQTGSAAESDIQTLEPFVVTATRIEKPLSDTAQSTDVFNFSTLDQSPSFTLDDTLRQSAAFSLFRRSGSLTANPTAQGVSLRGIGPSGASRSLVLFDGIPVNDPFGGWIAWNKLPLAMLNRVEIVRGGGSSVWGNAALGGTVQLITQTPDQTHLTTSVLAGDFATFGSTISGTWIGSPQDSLIWETSAFSTDGVPFRKTTGPVDQSSALNYQRAFVQWRHLLSDTTELRLSSRWFEEKRNNGTALQQNTSNEILFSAQLHGQPDENLRWDFSVYGQDQTYTSFFSAIDATRSTETPANNQYDVPAAVVGGSATFQWENGNQTATTLLGTDFRLVDGSTHEAYFWNGSRFTRDRAAGGRQMFLGSFAHHQKNITSTVSLSASLRADLWQNNNGYLQETNTESSTNLTNRHFPDNHGKELSPSLGVVWRIQPDFRLRAAANESFRLPTLNEYYRPFRVGSVTTLANENLSAEKLQGVEIGMDTDFTHGGWRATLFYNEIDHAVANVSLSANTRQRQNLDSTKVQGLELGGYWQITDQIRWNFDYLCSDARIVQGGPGASALDGRRLAQVPRHTLTSALRWQATSEVDLQLNGRWVSSQFEDDLNTLPLRSATTFDLGLNWSPNPRWQLRASVENILDAKVETGTSTTGDTTMGPPRWSRLEVSYRW